MLSRYEAFVIRRTTPRLGEERARHEGPARARFNLVVLIGAIIATLASIVRMTGRLGDALVLYLIGIVWCLFVVLTWTQLRRVRRLQAPAVDPSERDDDGSSELPIGPGAYHPASTANPGESTKELVMASAGVGRSSDHAT